LSIARSTLAAERHAGSHHTSRDIVIVATAFNLLFEYSLRGVNHLLERPVFPLFLIAAYASLFAMEEDLIRRYRLRDYHLVALAFTYGIVYQCLVSGTAFQHPTLFGIRWSHSLFVILVWWGGVQSVLTFYLANRLRPRNYDSSPMDRKGWLLALGINGIVISLFQASGKIPHGTPVGYATMLIVAALAAVTFARLARRMPLAEPFRRHLFIDLIVASTVVVFVICALVLTRDPTTIGTSDVNRLATRIIVAWTILAVAAALGYRLKTRRAIPI
jgi:hypothetical protein